ncbi:hypothetical protein GFC30_2 [Anoxybacillus amylolyticus]|uniref:Uncharacterized protein n=1 Tax=Anoxybacteroides amylolyticum TaxID=294699 RepID=A0A160F410_9BACL|nr:hypothetical protein GFC30_2 [Anoxybacillus amylolyticus]
MAQPRKHPTEAQAFDEDVRARRTEKAKAEEDVSSELDRKAEAFRICSVLREYFLSALRFAPASTSNFGEVRFLGAWQQRSGFMAVAMFSFERAFLSCCSLKTR